MELVMLIVGVWLAGLTVGQAVAYMRMQAIAQSILALYGEDTQTEE